jgi:hypothetical protein
VKLIFTPFGIAVGLLAGIVGRKIFEQIWGLIDKDEPPKPKHRDPQGWLKLGAALLLEGAVFRLVRGITDHGARKGFNKLTGSWPGDERPERE